MDPDLIPTSLLALVFLAANAFFITAEFALLTLHRSRVEQQAHEGDPWARQLLPALDSPGSLLLTAQLGSSTSTLALGILLAGITPVAAAFAVAVLLHAGLSAQIPKLVGINRGIPGVARVAIPTLRTLDLLLRPITWPLSRGVALLARLFGVRTPGFEPLVHTPEEIQMLVARGHEQGVVEEDEREMITSVFEFSQTVAREVMTPRVDVIAVPDDVALPELIRVVVEEGHSRFPVYSGTIDQVVGILLTKDLIPLLAEPGRPFDIRQVMREAYFVPDTKAVDEILAEFRQQKVHLAVVLDEFGGMNGVVTMEDLLEEIVGEIDDEYDISEPEYAPTPEGDVLIDGGASLSEVNERYGLAIAEEDYDTIGGYVFGALGRVPAAGDEVNGLGEEGDLVLVVEETEDRRVLRVRLTSKVEEESAL